MNVRTALIMFVLAVVNGAAVLSQPTDSDDVFPANHLYIASADAGVVFEVDPDALPGPVTGLPLPPGTLTGLPLPEVITGLMQPEDLVFGPEGLLYVTVRADDTVRVFDSAGDEESVLSHPSLDDPTGMVFDSRGGLFVSSFGTDRVLRFAPGGGAPTHSLGAGTPLDGPAGLAMGHDGHLYVASYNSDQVLEFDSSANHVGTIGGPGVLDGPWGITFSRRGHLVVVSSLQDRVKVFDPATGTLVDTLGDDVLLDEPADLVFGPDDKLWVTSSASDMLVRFDADGSGEILIDPTRGLARPRGLAFSPTLFTASLKGVFAAPGSKPGKAKLKNLLIGLTPGSGTITLLSGGGSSILGDAFDADVLVLHGLEDFGSTSSKTRSFHGTALGPDPVRDGMAVINLEVKGGKAPKNGSPAFVDAFRPGSAGGKLHLAGEGGILDGDVKAKVNQLQKKKSKKKKKKKKKSWK